MVRSSPNLSRIESLSFWRYTRLQKCKLSGALVPHGAESSSARPTLGRAQIIGAVFHAQMQNYYDLVKGGSLSGPELRKSFNEVLERVVSASGGNTLSRALGDPKHWPEVAEIYRSVTEMARRQRQAPVEQPSEVHTEETLYSKDKVLVGQLDAFFVDSFGIDLVDYKSGAIIDDEAPKDDYVSQLHLYAYLINENYGQYPRSMTLVGRNLEKYDVPGSAGRSNDIANHMRALRDEFNRAVDQHLPAEMLANPSNDNCLFCDVKPMCGSFWRALPALDLPKWANAAIGRQSEPFYRSTAGTVRLELEVEVSSLKTQRLALTRIHEHRYPHLQDRVGQRLMLTNIRSAGLDTPGTAEATDRTLIVPLGDEE